MKGGGVARRCCKRCGAGAALQPTFSFTMAPPLPMMPAATAVPDLITPAPILAYFLRDCALVLAWARPAESVSSDVISRMVMNFSNSGPNHEAER